MNNRPLLRRRAGNGGSSRRLVALVAIVFTSIGWADSSKARIATGNPALLPRVVQTISLPDVKGGFDLMALDDGQGRLFLNAEDNNSTEVLSVRGHGARLHTIRGMHQPKWVVYRPESSKLYVANGDGRVVILNSETYEIIDTLQFSESANNLRFDQNTGNLYVGVGNTYGAIAVIDTRSDTVVRKIPLRNFPKQFEVDGPRILVNVPTARRVQVVDRQSGATLDEWKTCESENIPMALDRRHHRLFVGCKAGELVVLDTISGRRVTTVPISKGADGIHYDEKKGRLYVSCAEGFLDIVQASGDRYSRLARLPTRPGAGTSLFAPSLRRIFVALPQSKESVAEIRGYDVDPSRSEERHSNGH